ncbi:MAG: hypothetical protein SNH79_04640 [Rikenellaceae bacterium]
MGVLDWLNRRKQTTNASDGEVVGGDSGDQDGPGDGRNLWSRGGRRRSSRNVGEANISSGYNQDNELEESREESYEELQRQADLAQARALEARAEELRRRTGQSSGGATTDWAEFDREGNSEGVYEVDFEPIQPPLSNAAPIAVSAPGNEDEQLDDSLDSSEDEEKEPEREIAASGSIYDILSGLISGNILENEVVSRFYVHALLLFILSFISISIWFWSLNEDSTRRALQDEVQLLHEESLRMQRARVRVSSYSAVERELERRNIGLTRSTRPAKNM